MPYVLSGNWELQPCEDGSCVGEETHVYSADFNDNATIVINNSGGNYDNLLVRDMQMAKDGNTITAVDGSGHQYPNYVNLWYSGEGCIDAVILNTGDFEGEFGLNVSEMQTIDRLYMSNVVSFTAVDDYGDPVSPVFSAENVNGNGETGDQNGMGYGDGTYDLNETGQGVDYYEVKYIDRNGDEQIIKLRADVIDGEKACISIDYICFARGTLIECEDGVKPVEALQPGDMVRTKDNGLQPIQWLASRKLSRGHIARNPHIKPIRIRAGALGEAMPSRDLVVSPQHRMLIDDWRCEAMFGEAELLIPAKALVNDHSVTVDHEANGVEYFHFMFEQHEIVYANGVESESFHPGDFGLSTLDEAALEELFCVFPHLEQNVDAFGEPARPVLKAFEARAMLSA